MIQETCDDIECHASSLFHKRYRISCYFCISTFDRI